MPDNLSLDTVPDVNAFALILVVTSVPILAMPVLILPALTFPIALIFVDAFTDIDPQVDRKLAQVWSNQKVQLIMERLRSDDNKVQKRKKIKTSTKVKIFFKDFLMRFILNSPKCVLLVVLKVVPSRWKKSIGDASPPDFGDKHHLEKLFMKPREELRLRANI